MDSWPVVLRAFDLRDATHLAEDDKQLSERQIATEIVL